MLVQKTIQRCMTEYAAISEIIIKTFPDEERIPDKQLKRPLVFTAFYDDGKFIGAAACLQTSRMMFVLYLFVISECRSQGYGSAIMKQLLQNAGSRPLVLNIEKLDPHAENYQERLRRFSFYQRCGLKDSGYQIQGDFCALSTLTSDDAFIPDDFLQVFQENTNYSPGIILIQKKQQGKR